MVEAILFQIRPDEAEEGKGGQRRHDKSEKEGEKMRSSLLEEWTLR